MKRPIVLSTLALLGLLAAAFAAAPSASGQDWAKATLAKSPRHGE